ncbi:glycosyltransferase family 1 protein [Kaistella sp. DKR-2]|uniref:glycosyltransferase family 1 protein n=1 Tax=Kaistella soli TaxID=2849654 RepID=UPI001C269972|nr:glycosyltransferase family 1 protein [Kaistella soli]MBU8883060.1 glycosyltransferase family 1 protein [Kaistella soli]
MKIKVLHVLTVLNRGGLETMLINYFRNSDRAKFEYHFLVHRNNGMYEKEILENGGFIHRMPPLSFSVSGFSKYLRKLDEFFGKNRFDILHVHNNSFGYYPLKFGKKHGIPVRIMHSHISSLRDDWKKVIFGKYLNTKIPNVANVLFACGLDAGKWMYGNKEFSVIPNAINSDDFAFNSEKRVAIRKKLFIKDGLAVMNVARFQPQKNHFFLLEIIAELNKIQAHIHLFLVGEGDLKVEIEAKVKKLGIEDKVTFLGSRSDVHELLQAMDVFLFPSLFEGLPVSLVEAQASGIHCVISDGIPGEAVLVPENVTVIPLRKTAEEWAQQILALDVSGRKDVTEIIIEKGYDIKDNARKLETKYFDLLKNTQFFSAF